MSLYIMRLQNLLGFWELQHFAQSEENVMFWSQTRNNGAVNIYFTSIKATNVSSKKTGEDHRGKPNHSVL